MNWWVIRLWLLIHWLRLPHLWWRLLWGGCWECGTCGGGRGCWFCLCCPAAAIFCRAMLILFICSWRLLKFRVKLSFIVEFCSVSCEITVELAAKASPKFATASSNVMSSSKICPSVFAEKLSDAAVVSVSWRKLYASCQNVWNSSQVRCAAGSARHSLYSLV